MNRMAVRLELGKEPEARHPESPASLPSRRLAAPLSTWTLMAMMTLQGRSGVEPAV